MAEVSLTLVDPELYDGTALPGEEGGDWSSDGSSERGLDIAGDWDEARLRRQKAEETEEAVRAAQPGVVIGIDGSVVDAGQLDRDLIDESETDDAPAPAEAVKDAAPGVVLKVAAAALAAPSFRAGEVTITRRLFRSGDSEYLINGKSAACATFRTSSWEPAWAARPTPSSARSASARSSAPSP